MTVNKWIKNNTRSLSGKTVAISGSTGGLGRELCLHLCDLGADLILLDRNLEKSRALAEVLRKRRDGIVISHITVDMEDIDTVKAAASKLIEKQVDHLILNAGAYCIPRKKCTTGFDNVFMINFVSPYYLARTLLDSISSRNGKIVIVGSIAHNYSKIDPEDVDFSSREKASLVYGNAKRHLMYGISERFGDTGAVSITHPGITFTNITAHYPKLIFAVIKYPMKVIFMSPRRAALSILYGLFTNTEKNEWIGPRLFNVWGLPKKKKLSTATAHEIEAIANRAEEIFDKIITNDQ